MVVRLVIIIVVYECGIFQIWIAFETCLNAEKVPGQYQVCARGLDELGIEGESMRPLSREDRKKV